MKRIVKWFLIGAGAVLAVLVIALAAVIVLDGMSVARLDAVTNTRIPNAGGPEVRAHVARPAAPGTRPAAPGTRPAAPGTHPAVIMIHEFWGLDESIVGKAEALAQEGYVVAAPNLFRGSTASTVPRAIFQVVTTPPQQVNADLDAVYEWLAAQPDVDPDRIAVMGFCFGGASSLRYSLANDRLAATAIFYGQTIDDVNALKALPGPVLGIFGGADASIPVSEVRSFEAALERAGVPHEISVYEGQPHAFVTSVEEIRKGGAQGQAWDQLLAFLRQSLQGGGSSERTVDPTAYDAAPDWGYWVRLALSHLEHRH